MRCWTDDLGGTGPPHRFSRWQGPRLNKRGLALLLASLLAAASAHAACEIAPTAETALSDTFGFLTVPASIDGERASLILDTGSESGLIEPEAAARLRLPSDPLRYSLVQGTGGDGGFSPHVLIRRLEIGTVAVRGWSIPLGPLPARPRLAPPVAGLLGADLLSGFDVELDVPQRRLALHPIGGPPARCEEVGAPPWPGAFDTLPLRRSGNRLLAEVAVNGQKMTALIDTGAQSITIGTASARRAGVGAPELERDPGGIGGGVDMREVPFHWHRFATFQIGRETIQNPVLTVSPLQEDADLLLGSPFFATRRVWLSYSGARMFVQLSRGR
jgi:predicted aspartyl protease